jgi:hypothetical protein
LDHRDKWDLEAHPDQLVSLAHKDLQDHLVDKVTLDQLDPLALLAKLAHPEKMVVMEAPVHMENLDHQDKPAHKVPEDFPVHLVSPEARVTAV